MFVADFRQLARAFTLFFQLANLTEQVHRAGENSNAAGWLATDPSPRDEADPRRIRQRRDIEECLRHMEFAGLHRHHRSVSANGPDGQRRIADLLDEPEPSDRELCCESNRPVVG